LFGKNESQFSKAAGSIHKDLAKKEIKYHPTDGMFESALLPYAIKQETLG
jgi:hypothetical protein